MIDDLYRTIVVTDHFRYPGIDHPHPDWYKEWHHFAIIAPDVQLILNFSVCRDTRPTVPPGTLLGRMVLLVRDASGWDGDVDTFQPYEVELTTGRIDLCMGHNRVTFGSDGFSISAALENRPVTVRLQLVPVVYPIMRRRTSIGEGSISWLAIPRLVVQGEVTIGRRVYRLAGASAYHDHNWGNWLWGHDFSWHWGYALPETPDNPWSLIFDHLMTGTRNHRLELRLAIWKDAILQRLFLHGEIETHQQGFFQRREIRKFPRIMTLIAPQTTTDVPRVLSIHAASKDDYLNCVFEAQDVVQIAIPNETNLGVTIINEVSGLLTTEGRIKGESVAIAGSGFFEFLTC
ncbi:MAG TPA: hypothetical protein VKY59_00450 [Spirillospora sp.]|nr:hypothetical protein [Spirillospora sp.]